MCSVLLSEQKRRRGEHYSRTEGDHQELPDIIRYICTASHLDITAPYYCGHTAYATRQCTLHSGELAIIQTVAACPKSLASTEHSHSSSIFKWHRAVAHLHVYNITPRHGACVCSVEASRSFYSYSCECSTSLSQGSTSHCLSYFNVNVNLTLTMTSS